MRDKSLRYLHDGLYESWKKELKLGDGLAELTKGMRKLGILSKQEHLNSYEETLAWQRGGAETYVAVASYESNLSKTTFIAKALVSIGVRPEVQLKKWIENRALLENSGILVPKLLGTDPGTIYEEYIENDFFVHQIDNEEVLYYLGFLASKLDALCFHTIEFERDLRVRGKEIYYTDFGQDLGSTSLTPSNNAVTRLKRILPKGKYDVATLGFASQSNVLLN